MRFLPLVIVIGNDIKVQIYINIAYTVHINSKGHLEMYLVMEIGAMISVLKKLGLVTAIPTKTEVVVDRECFSKYSWFRYFSLAQGD